MIFRTAAQKADLSWSWHRGDRAFFASGACHVLAYHFLQSAQGRGFRPMMIVPDRGFRGGHVIATDGTLAFDYHGFSSHPRFIVRYWRKIRAYFPGWRGSLVDLSGEFWTEAWFSRYQYRQPHQFLADPTERALRFIRQIGQPPSIADRNRGAFL